MILLWCADIVQFLFDNFGQESLLNYAFVSTVIAELVMSLLHRAKSISLSILIDRHVVIRIAILLWLHVVLHLLVLDANESEEVGDQRPLNLEVQDGICAETWT